MAANIALVLALLVGQTNAVSMPALRNVAQGTHVSMQEPPVPKLQPGVVWLPGARETLATKEGFTPSARALQEPEAASGKCDDMEREALAPVINLTSKVRGKNMETSHIKPLEDGAPECYAEHMDTAAYEVCYSALGFVFGVSKCLAKESMSIWPTCGKYCHDSFSVNTVACQTCLKNVRAIREDCVMDYMGISAQCKECHDNARTYWSENCMFQCVDGEYNCQGCWERTEQKLKACNYQS